MRSELLVVVGLMLCGALHVAGAESPEKRVEKDKPEESVDKDTLSGKALATKYSEAEQLLEKSKKSRRERSMHHNLKLGWQKIATGGNLTEAMKYFDEAEKIDPKDVGVLKAKSWALHMKGDTSAAIASLTKAAEADPDNRINYISDRVALHTKLGMYPEALKDSEECLKSDPLVPSYWRNHARLLVKLKRYDEAAKAYQKGTDLDKEEPVLFSGDKDMCREMQTGGATSGACGAILAEPTKS